MSLRSYPSSLSSLSAHVCTGLVSLLLASAASSSLALVCSVTPREHRIHLIPAYNSGNRWRWHLQTSGHRSQGRTSDVEIDGSLRGVVADFTFWFFLWCHTSCVFEVSLELLHPRVCLQLTGTTVLVSSFTIILMKTKKSFLFLNFVHKHLFSTAHTCMITQRWCNVVRVCF